MNLFDQVQAARGSLLRETDNSLTIDCALILGTGLSDVATELEASGMVVRARIPYTKIEHMPSSGVIGHEGACLIAEIDGLIVLIFQGRFHLYEGWSPIQAAFPVYLSAALGAKTLIISNAAGGLNANFTAGRLMLIEDHLNFTGHNPLVGWEDERIGPRFPDMSRCYCPELIKLARNHANELNIELEQGNYAAVLGPSLETSAERRFLRQAGGDAVGMSTAMEVIAAAQCDVKVLGFSAISNMATGGPEQQPDTIESVLAMAGRAAADLTQLLPGLLASIKPAARSQ